MILARTAGEFAILKRIIEHSVAVRLLKVLTFMTVSGNLFFVMSVRLEFGILNA